MKAYFKLPLFTLMLLILTLVSCSHQKPQERSVAAQSCLDSVRPEYHSYFDSVEKCMDKEPQK